MSDGLSTLPIPRQQPRTAPATRPRTPAPGRPRTPAPPSRPRSVAPAARRTTAAARPSLARRRWGFAVAVVLMLATLPVHLLGLALIGIQLLSPSTDGSEPVFIGGVGAAQLLLLVAVASAGQLVGGGNDVWRRRMAFTCLNALLVVAAAGVGWALLL